MIKRTLTPGIALLGALGAAAGISAAFSQATQAVQEFNLSANPKGNRKQRRAAKAQARRNR